MFAYCNFKNQIIMRKIFIALVGLVLMSGVAVAQETTNIVSKKGEQYLPQAGDWSVGFEANDMVRFFGNFFTNSSNGAPELSLIDNRFVGKYMDSGHTAYRLIADLRIGNLKSVSIRRDLISGAADITTTDKQNEFGLNLGVGREWRRGTTRLQGYYGADAFVGLNRSSDSRTVNNPDTDPVNHIIKEKGGLGFLIGARGFIGAEYFVLPKMALGAEYSYGISFNMVGEGVTTETGEDDVKTGRKGSAFYFGGATDGVNYGVISLKLSLYF